MNLPPSFPENAPPYDSSRTFEERNSNRTNKAETKAEEFFKNKGIPLIRFGFDEKEKHIDTKHWFKIPEIVRSSPDYILISKSSYFLEVKGFQKDLKVKITDLVMMDQWNRLMPIVIFAYDCGKDVPYVIQYKKLWDRIHTCPILRYQDNRKLYYSLGPDVLRYIAVE